MKSKKKPPPMKSQNKKTRFRRTKSAKESTVDLERQSRTLRRFSIQIALDPHKVPDLTWRAAGALRRFYQIYDPEILTDPQVSPAPGRYQDIGTLNPPSS